MKWTKKIGGALLAGGLVAGLFATKAFAGDGVEDPLYFEKTKCADGYLMYNFSRPDERS